VSRRVDCDCKPHALLAYRDHQQKILKHCVMPSQYAQDPAAEVGGSYYGEDLPLELKVGLISTSREINWI